MIISQRIKELRTENGISQKALAEEIGMKNTAVSNYENGVSTPDLNTAVAIAKFFHCSLDYLAGLTDDRFRDAADSVNLKYYTLWLLKAENGVIVRDKRCIHLSERIIGNNLSVSAFLSSANLIYITAPKKSYQTGDNIVVFRNDFYSGKYIEEGMNKFCHLYTGEKIKIEDTLSLKGILINLL